ncbi:MAG: T9SS type A sorting domain-containing protein [Bacteroidia bacterium]|nr:FG-GAP-like repeat-containing protein [Bacteroidia bacterium]MDW8133506.1 T9SS type A sorting domain-containing protein [Bacteroidia bacterium]
MSYLRLITLIGIVWGQWKLRRVNLPVVVDQDTLINAWAGGWNAPQISKVDIDGDGVEELFCFDRTDGRISIFRLAGQRWYWMPEADTLLPPALSQWVLLRDYDSDGDKDLFTNVQSYIRVFQNIATPGNAPKWKLLHDTLISDYSGFPTYLYSGSIDIPAICDVDNDGDVDLLVYEVLGALIEWHKNHALEELGRSDTLVLRLQSSCWGHVYEVYDYAQNVFSFQPYTCGAGQREENPLPLRVHHAGGTILPIDLNGDGLRDLIVGDDGPPYLIAGINTGSLQIAHIEPSTAITPYPPQFPLFLPSFPSSYYEDVTGDGKPDLICANNSGLTGEDNLSIWLYENTNRIDSPNWAPPVVGWLQNTQLDAGTAAHPTLADINRDGYPDLILSSEGYYRSGTSKSRAFLYWGTPTGFELADSNWLNLPQYANLRNPIFAVEDIDGNGKLDLIAGTSTGELWRWEENTSGAMNFSLITQSFGGITGPPFAAPLLYDYDNDGDLDLIIGGRNGRLSLYRQDAPLSFSLITNFLGQIDMRDTLSTLIGFARPALSDLNQDGIYELMVGNLTGFLRVFLILSATPSASWPMVADIPYRGGKRASPTTWIRPDSSLCIIGNAKGGAHAFVLERTSGTTLSPTPALYNPPYVMSQSPLSIVLLSSGRGEVYSLSGQKLFSFEGHGHIPLPSLPEGVYLLRLHIEGKEYIEKFYMSP